MNLENQILEMYENDFASFQIEKELKINYQKVVKVLLSYGIDYKAEFAKKSSEKYSKALELYNIGISPRKICSDLKIGRNALKSFLKKNAITYRNNEEGRISSLKNRSADDFIKLSKAHQKYDINNNAFDNLNDPETAYWIGFLYADGTKRKSETTFSISLNNSDKGHLEKFCNFLKTPVERLKYVKSNDSCQLTIGNYILVKKLEEIGFTNKKSWDAVPPKSLENNINFWRGVVDGDGSLGVYLKNNKETASVSICGTFETCEKFKECIEDLTQRDLSNIKINKITETFYTFRLSQIYTVKDTLSLLYKDSIIYLDRKYNKYLEINKI